MLHQRMKNKKQPINLESFSYMHKAKFIEPFIESFCVKSASQEILFEIFFSCFSNCYCITKIYRVASDDEVAGGDIGTDGVLID